MKLFQLFESLESDLAAIGKTPSNTHKEDYNRLREKYDKATVEKLLIKKMVRSWYTSARFGESIGKYGYTFEELNKNAFFKKCLAEYVEEYLKRSSDDHNTVGVFNDADSLVGQWEDENVSVPEARKKVNDFLMSKMKDGKIIKSLLSQIKHGNHDDDDDGEDAKYVVNSTLKRLEKLKIKSKELDLIKASLKKG